MKINNLILNPLHIIIIAAVSSVPYILLMFFIEDILLVTIAILQTLIGLILIVLHSKKLTDQPVFTWRDKTVLIILCTLNPITGVIAYSLLLRTSQNLKKVIALGLQVALLCVIFSIIYALLLPTLRESVTPQRTWTAEQADEFKSYVTAIEQDIDTIFTHSEKQDVAATRAACVQLETSIAKGGSVDAFPDETIQNQLTNGLTKLNEAAKNCLKGIDEGDVEAANKSTKQILAGYQDLDKATLAMQQK